LKRCTRSDALSVVAATARAPIFSKGLKTGRNAVPQASRRLANKRTD
jgi:hypothetical protein